MRSVTNRYENFLGGEVRTEKYKISIIISQKFQYVSNIFLQNRV